jgi:hypothetical protein
MQLKINSGTLKYDSLHRVVEKNVNLGLGETSLPNL